MSPPASWRRCRHRRWTVPRSCRWWGWAGGQHPPSGRCRTPPATPAAPAGRTPPPQSHLSAERRTSQAGKEIEDTVRNPKNPIQEGDGNPHGSFQLLSGVYITLTVTPAGRIQSAQSDLSPIIMASLAVQRKALEGTLILITCNVAYTVQVLTIF